MGGMFHKALQLGRCMAWAQQRRLQRRGHVSTAFCGRRQEAGFSPCPNNPTMAPKHLPWFCLQPVGRVVSQLKRTCLGQLP